MAGAHFTFDGDHGAVRIGNRLPLGHLAHQALAVLGESHHRGGGTRAFRIGDNRRLAAFHNRDAAVCSTQVNANNLSHNILPPNLWSIAIFKLVCYSAATLTMA